MLVDGETCGNELRRGEKTRLNAMNLSLFAWMALQRSGCPLLKKQVLIGALDCHGFHPLSRLQGIVDADVALREDLETLLQSRYLGP